MKTFEEALTEALEEAKTMNDKVFLVQFGADKVDDATVSAWAEKAKAFEDMDVKSVERNDVNTVKVVVGKGGSVSKLKNKWMVSKVYKSE